MSFSKRQMHKKARTNKCQHRKNDIEKNGFCQEKKEETKKVRVPRTFLVHFNLTYNLPNNFIFYLNRFTKSKICQIRGRLRQCRRESIIYASSPDLAERRNFSFYKENFAVRLSRIIPQVKNKARKEIFF